jgi:SAM-dependent methyltransferase
MKGARRSLTHVGGAVTTGGDAAAAALLAGALDVPPRSDDDDAPERAHVHGFHTYAARMHPLTAARLVEAFAPKGGTVLDPFCGSGTVLVEALLAGRAAVGTDLNPLAVLLSRLKTRVTTREERDALVEDARAAAAFATERRKTRAGATRRLAPEDVALFDPHVAMELDSVRGGIEVAARLRSREALGLVLSALLVKLSRKRADTSERTEARRIAAGYPTKLFVKKTEELARRLAVFAERLASSPSPSPSPLVRVEIDDATKLASVAPRSIDAAVTSPPYLATYDYAAHHALRMRWLGLDPRPFEQGELGARRAYQRLSPRDAERAWKGELERVLRSIARVVRPGAPVVLLMADSAVGTTAIRAHDLVADVAPGVGLEPIARASQARPHFHGPTAAAFAKQPRAEHALLLRREEKLIREPPRRQDAKRRSQG